MKPWLLICVFILPLLGGCWAISDVAANRRFEHSLPYGTPIQANGISALTPQAYLLIKKIPAGFVLNDADGFLSYAVVHNKLSTFDGIVAKDRETASILKTAKVECRDGVLDIYMARFDRGDRVKLVYYTYFGSADNGISAEYTEHYYDTAFKGESGRDTIPAFFVRFLNSIQFDPSAGSVGEISRP